MERKIAFFDIDGTLTSELDGTIPVSTKNAIRKARQNGHLMFINTGRCMQNVEKRFLEVGFDGIICGCGTNIYCEENGMLRELLYAPQTHAVTYEILTHARNFELDILFESKGYVRFDTKKPFYTKDALKQYEAFVKRGYNMSQELESYTFTCDKFVIWLKNIEDLNAFKEVSDKYFVCIDRGGYFREFVPIGYSKATGIQFVLDYYQLPLESSCSFGDSNNDLPMLNYTKYSVAMGNSVPKSLFDNVTYISAKASQNGIQQALEYYHFI